jgi:hypothetical protein
MDDGNREGESPVAITPGMKIDGIELVIHRLERRFPPPRGSSI